MKILLVVSWFVYLILNAQADEIKKIEDENDYYTGLERLKKLFFKNGMNVFGQIEHEENLPPRNPENLVPVDELPLFRNGRHLDSESISTIQGDMILDEPEILYSNSRSKRRIITTNLFGNPTRWPNGIIPYEFDIDASDSLKTKFQMAIQIWHQHTCIQFEPYSSTLHPNHRSRVLVKNRGHCAARVGYSIDPNQKVGITDVYLPEHCPLGSVLHELGHVIGFRHEHTRYDRTDHINVHYERMQSSQRPQYDIMENGFPGYFGIYYDLYSIMHYSAQNGLIESKDEKRGFLMGQRFNLSFSDIKMANQAYNCKDQCLNKTVKCQNEGFIDKNCNCKCPEHITGRFCETVMKKQISMRSLKSPQLTCDFELDLCDWLQEDSRDSEEWIRNKGLTKTQINFKKENTRFKTGPQLLEEDRKNSTYIYLNSYDQTKAYANAILISPQILVNKTENCCLKFYYHMYAFPSLKMDAPEVGKLKVRLRTSDGNIKQIWEKFGNQGELWKFTEIDLKIEPPHTVIFFEAEVIDWKYGDIALDDIEFKHGLCKDDEWSEWNNWTNCSKQCGGGIKSRHRKCLKKSCIGNSTEYSECNLMPCPIDEWEPWSECSTKCGYGIQTRLKTCSKKTCGLILEKKVCFINESCPIKKWSNWSEWSECSNKCGKGYSVRFRDCLLNKTCEGLDKEVKVCFDESECPKEKPVWSDWSLWSSCITKEKCSIGIKVRRRFCLLNSKLVHNSNCPGYDTETLDCKEICEPEIIEPKWSEWSNCSTKCGNGIMTRTKLCSGFKCTDEFIYDQKSCYNDECPGDYNYMECTFDKTEYCPLEQIEKGNSIWEIDGPTLYSYSKFKLTPSIVSGGQFITVKGKNKKSSIQTPIISHEKIPKGQCLSFYYFIDANSKIQVNKVNLDGRIQTITDKESETKHSEWKKVSILLQSSSDYFIEFTAFTGTNSDSIIAIDDITLSPFENCIVLKCDFDDSECKANQVLGLSVSHKIWINEQYLKSNLRFLRVDLSQVKENIPVFYGLPVINPSYATMCLNFMYFLNGQGSTELRIGLVQGPKLLSYIWKEKTSSTGVWKKAFIDFQIENEFQIMLELLRFTSDPFSINSSMTIEIIALDNFKISYGTCDLLKKNLEFEQELSRRTYKKDLSTQELIPSDLLIDKCGGVYMLEANQSTTIQSPGYPISYPINLYCSYLIKTRDDLKLQISIYFLDLEDNDRHDQCIDYLEIRYFNLGQPGPKYCGKLQKNNEDFTITSFKNDLLLLFSSDWAITKSGFRVGVKTV
ncbi:unnamed protein product [Brachionus calyciflorus]|uniref:Metalloendopeptidase n=1 Tax=Brachionus calyciflorus TaxID=104777 RepID=A0A813MJW4_9BILA|nr:unnamed protein product [Brachionus calyciflorus]